ncbi:LexA family protein [Spirosoma fluminis]
MRVESDSVNPRKFVKAIVATRYNIPFFLSPVPAGFTSPATDYIEKVCDLNELCISHPEMTYFVRCIGDSMIEDGLWDGDIMIVDRSFDKERYEGRIIVAWLNDEFTVKRYHKPGELVILRPANPAYQPIYVQPEPIDKFKVFGVVTFWIKKAQFKHLHEP